MRLCLHLFLRVCDAIQGTKPFDLSFSAPKNVKVDVTSPEEWNRIKGANEGNADLCRCLLYSLRTGLK